MALLVSYRGESWIFRWAPILVIVAVVLSLSRTAAVVDGLMIPFLFLRSNSSRRLGKLIFGLSILSIVSYRILQSYSPFRDRFIGGDSAVLIGGSALNTSGRMQLWAATIESAGHNSILGAGPGSADIMISRLFGTIGHPHNDYLRIYHDFGLVGLTLFSVGMIMLVSRIWKRVRENDFRTVGEVEIHAAAKMNRASQIFSIGHNHASATRLGTGSDGGIERIRVQRHTIRHRAELRHIKLAPGKFRWDDAFENVRHGSPRIGGGRSGSKTNLRATTHHQQRDEAKKLPTVDYSYQIH